MEVFFTKVTDICKHLRTDEKAKSLLMRVIFKITSYEYQYIEKHLQKPATIFDIIFNLLKLSKLKDSPCLRTIYIKNASTDF